MSTPFPVIALVLFIITIVVLMEVIILIIPARISLALHSHGTDTTGILAGSWFIFGLELLVSGKDPQLSVTAGRTRLISQSLPTGAAPEKNHVEGPGPGQVPGTVSSLLALRGPVLAALLDLARHTRLDYVRGNARIGLGDPAATGMLYGLYRALIPLLPVDRINLTMIPEFSQEVCEIDITTRFHVTYPILVLVNAVKIMKRPAARRVMNIMRSKAGDVAA